MNLLTKAALMTFAILAMTACGSKKGSSAAAASVPATGSYVTCTTGTNPTTGQPCQIGSQIYVGGAQTTTCPANGLNPYNNQPCVVGSVIYANGTQNTNLCPSTGLNPYTNQPCVVGSPIGQVTQVTQQDPCISMYGYRWHTIYIGGTPMCERY